MKVVNIPSTKMMKKLVRRANMGTVIARSKCRGMLANELSASLRAKRRNPSHSIMDGSLPPSLFAMTALCMLADASILLDHDITHARTKMPGTRPGITSSYPLVDSERFDYAWLAT